MKRCRLRWHGHVERKGDADCVKVCVRSVMEERLLSAGQRNTAYAYIRLLNVETWDAHDRVTFRA